MTELFGAERLGGEPGVIPPYFPAINQSPVYFPQYGFPTSPYIAHPSFLPQPAKLDPAVEKRLAEIERAYQEASNQYNELKEYLLKQEQEREKEKYERQLEALRQEIVELKTGGGKGEEQSWLDAYLRERDKREEEMHQRYQETIKVLGERLEAVSKEAMQAKREVEERARAQAEERDRLRQQAKKELEELGYAPRKKEAEEKMLEIAEKDVIPGVVSELRETGKAIRDLTRRGGSEAPQQQPQQPASPEESQRRARVWELEQEIRGRGEL
jgi:hypothetical protein